MQLSFETHSTSVVAASFQFNGGLQNAPSAEKGKQEQNLLEPEKAVKKTPNALEIAAQKVEEDAVVIAALSAALDDIKGDKKETSAQDDYRNAASQNSGGKKDALQPNGPHQIAGKPPHPGGPGKLTNFKIEGFESSTTRFETDNGFSGELTTVRSYSIGPEGISFSERSFGELNYDDGNGTTLSYESQRATHAYAGRGQPPEEIADFSKLFA